MTTDSVVLVAGARTPIGRFGGSLSSIDAHELGAHAIKSALSRGAVDPADVDEVVMGQVGQVGADAFNARRCALAAGVPASATAMNVNRLCGSGLQAIVTGAHQLLLGEAAVVVAGGNESMSRQPFFDYGARRGWRLGNGRLVDGTLALVTDPWGGYPMGETAERVAERYGVSREEQDRFALTSQARTAAATSRGAFVEEIAPIDVLQSRETVSVDEHPRPDTTLETLERLSPAFRANGTVTAGNSSGLNDGAAAVVMMREATAAERNLEPILRFRGVALSGIEPEVMGYAPALAIPKVLAKVGLDRDQLDLVELNEAFAAQAIAVIRDAGLDEARVNPNGGAIALGHPIGATGAILTVKLMHALRGTAHRFGLVAMCIGGGQGIAAVFERVT